MGKIIKKPEEILKLALKYKCVDIQYGTWKCLPCAFVQNLQFKYLMQLIKAKRVRMHDTKEI